VSFSWPVRVYWEDTDGGGIVYYASYLRYLERARTEWLRSRGYSQSALASEPGIVFAVAHLTIDYRRPAKLDDALTVTCEPEAVGPASLRFKQQIYRCDASPVEGSVPAQSEGVPQGELLVAASLRVACVDARTLRPRRLPDSLALALQ
jgi:acyl-CoA thioester hydrolase